MIENELNFRKKVILGIIGLLSVFTGMIALNYFSGDLLWTFFPGFFIGSILGVAHCLYLSEVWDPELLAMKGSTDNPSKKKIPWLWMPPLGVLAGNIVAQFLGGEIAFLLAGVTAGWLYVLFGYATIQVWRYRPK